MTATRDGTKPIFDRGLELGWACDGTKPMIDRRLAGRLQSLLGSALRTIFSDQSGCPSSCGTRHLEVEPRSAKRTLQDFAILLSRLERGWASDGTKPIITRGAPSGVRYDGLRIIRPFSRQEPKSDILKSRKQDQEFLRRGFACAIRSPETTTSAA
jgi:hypothetical protein